MVRIALLGPLEVRSADDAVVPVTGAPQRLVVARLALGAGRVVSTDALVDALWGEEPPANALGNLRSYVSRARRMLGTGVIEREAAGYRLRVAADDVDVARLDGLLAEVRAARDDPARRADLLARALGLWRGEALAEFAGVPAFDAERVRLDELRSQLVEDHLEARLDLGEARTLLPELEAAVRARPERERLVRALMVALHRDGRTADALRVGAEHRERTVERSGLDPGPELAELERRILDDDAGLRVSTAAATAPEPGERDRRPPAEAGTPRPRARRAPADRFVGRAGELATVRDHLREHRLVSIVGPGGIGKTRLALELVDAIGEGAGAPCAPVVELARAATGDEVPATIAEALGVRAAPDDALRAIGDALAVDGTLVLLDNCEHVADAVAATVATLLADQPGLTILATSRRPLGLTGEQVFRLGPLGEDDRIELFVDRASRARSGFRLRTHDRELVADICGLFDGLPLAVELAARRESVLGLRQLRARLAEDLAAVDRAAPGDGGRSVRATIEWSRNLLAPAARRVLDRLSVCAGGFPLDAVEQLAPDGIDAVAALADLVDASLVLADLDADPPRYTMLEVTRQVVAAQLDPDERDEAGRAHARWVATVADRLTAATLARSSDATALLRRERANLRAGLHWLLEHGERADAARVAVGMCAFVEDPDPTLVGMLDGIPGAAPGAAPIADDADAVLRIASGGAAWLRGDQERAERLLGEALAALPEDHPDRWLGLYFHALSNMFQGDVDGVEVEARALLAATANPWVRAEAVCLAALINLFAGRRGAAEAWMSEHAAVLERARAVDSIVAYTEAELLAEPDPERALERFARAYRVADDAGHTYNREIASVGRVAVLVRLGRHEIAAEECAHALGRLRALGMWPQVWTTLRLSAELLVASGHHLAAAEVLAAADADPHAPAVLGPDRARQQRLWETIHRHCDAPAVEHARATGIAAGRAQTIDRALASLAGGVRAGER